MSFLMPKMPDVHNVAVPSRSDADVQNAANEQRRKIASETKVSDWLTGGLGVPRGQQAYTATKLLGGGA